MVTAKRVIYAIAGAVIVALNVLSARIISKWDVDVTAAGAAGFVAGVFIGALVIRLATIAERRGR